MNRNIVWPTWIAVLDRPYYPRVEQYDNRRAAEAAAERMLTEAVTEDGPYTGMVYVAKVARRTPVTTDH